VAILQGCGLAQVARPAGTACCSLLAVARGTLIVNVYLHLDGQRKESCVLTPSGYLTAASHFHGVVCVQAVRQHGSNDSLSASNIPYVAVCLNAPSLHAARTRSTLVLAERTSVEHRCGKQCINNSTLLNGLCCACKAC
jgi:hypothetical protein